MILNRNFLVMVGTGISTGLLILFGASAASPGTDAKTLVGTSAVGTQSPVLGAPSLWSCSVPTTVATVSPPVLLAAHGGNSSQWCSRDSQCGSGEYCDLDRNECVADPPPPPPPPPNPPDDDDDDDREGSGGDEDEPDNCRYEMQEFCFEFDGGFLWCIYEWVPIC